MGQGRALLVSLGPLVQGLPKPPSNPEMGIAKCFQSLNSLSFYCAHGCPVLDTGWGTRQRGWASLIFSAYCTGCRSSCQRAQARALLVEAARPPAFHICVILGRLAHEDICLISVKKASPADIFLRQCNMGGGRCAGTLLAPPIEVESRP